jgi:hypothetical protein
MARKATMGVGRGGARPGAGRPRGSKSRTYRPHLEKQLQAAGVGILPKDVLLAIMHLHFEAGRWAEAERTAALVAPFIHPKLTASSVAVKPPSIAQQIVEMSDEELREHIAELNQLAGLSLDTDEEELAIVKARGSA